MSRTLSSNVSSGKSGGSNVCYLLQVQSDTTTYYWATEDFTDGAISYDGGVLIDGGLGKIINEIDLSRGGGAEKITDWSFSIGNADLAWDTLCAENFENRDVELRVIFTDKTSPSWANASPLFIGYIADVPEVGVDRVTFRCRRGSYNRHKTIPTKVLTKDRFPELPNENEGKLIGIVYGDFFGDGINRQGIAYSALGSSPYMHRDYIRGLITKRITGLVSSGWDGRGRLALAEHELLANRNSDDAERIFLWDDLINGFIGIDINDVTTDVYCGYDNPSGIGTTLYNESGGFDKNFIYLASGSKWYYFIPRYDAVLSSSSGISNPQNAVNENPDDNTTLSANNTDYVVISDIVEDGSNLVWDSVKIFLDRDGDETVDYTITDGTNTTSGTITTFGSIASISISGWSGNPMEAAVKITLNTNLVGGTFNNVYVKLIHIACKTAAYSSQTDENGELFQTVQGRMFHKWIDSPNHSNSFSAGDLIEHPAYVIESILCDSCRLTTGGITGAIEFDGSDDSLVVKHSDALALTGNMTIALWVYLDANNSRAIIRKATAAASTIPAPFDYWLDSNGKPVLSRGNGSAYQDVTATNAVGTGEWHHIAVTVSRSSGTDTVYHYLDGAANGNNTMTPTVSDTSGDVLFSIACRASNRFDGKMDEVCIWNKALSADEITAEYNSGSGTYHRPGEEYLVGCWHFDEGAGYTYLDDSGCGHDAGTHTATYVPSRVAGQVETEQQIDEDGFDTIAAIDSSLAAAIQLTDERNTRDLIAEICHEFGFGFRQRYNGLESIAQITQGSAVHSTALYSPNFKMIGEETSFRISRGSMGDMFNEFYLYYQENYATGNQDRVAYIRNPQATAFNSQFTNLTSDGETYWDLCRTAYTKYKTTRRWELKSKWIRDKATADAVLKWFVTWLARIPYYIHFTSALDTMNLELCDEQIISHDIMPDAMDSTTRFRLVRQVIDPNTDTIENTFLEVA